MSEGARALGPEYEFKYAYIWYNGEVYKPGSTLRAPAGATLTARAWVKNTNNIPGTACYGVVWDGYYRCGPKTKDANAGVSWLPMPDCTFSMPSTDKDAVLHCGSYEGGTCYTHDETDPIYLRVQATPTPEEGLLYTTETYQIVRSEEATLLDTTETYQIVRSEEEGLLYTTQTYQIERQLSVIECLFIRLSTGKPFPRIAQQNPIPRVMCIAEAIKAMWREVKP